MEPTSNEPNNNLSWNQRRKLRAYLRRTAKEIKKTDDYTEKTITTYKPKLLAMVIELNTYLQFCDDDDNEYVRADFETMDYHELKKLCVEGIDVLRRYA